MKNLKETRSSSTKSYHVAYKTDKGYLGYNMSGHKLISEAKKALRADSVRPVQTYQFIIEITKTETIKQI